MLIRTPFSLFPLIYGHFALTSAQRYASVRNYILWHSHHFSLYLYNISYEQSDCLNMHRHFFIILHGKKNRSKNSQLSPGSCLCPIHPFLRYFTPFQSAHHTYTHWQTFCLFRFASEYIFNPFGYRRDFFPERSIFTISSVSSFLQNLSRI